MEELKENNAPRDRAILVGLSSPRLDRKENADEESLEELGALVETAGGVVLKIKGYACGKEYGTEDSYGLGILVLDYRHHERQAGCQQEYSDNRVVELAEV